MCTFIFFGSPISPPAASPSLSSALRLPADLLAGVGVDAEGAEDVPAGDDTELLDSACVGSSSSLYTRPIV